MSEAGHDLRFHLIGGPCHGQAGPITHLGNRLIVPLESADAVYRLRSGTAKFGWLDYEFEAERPRVAVPPDDL